MGGAGRGGGVVAEVLLISGAGRGGGVVRPSKLMCRSDGADSAVLTVLDVCCRCSMACLLRGMSSRSALGTVELPMVAEAGARFTCAVSVVMSMPNAGRVAGMVSAPEPIAPWKNELTDEPFGAPLWDSAL
eukprot:3863878-Amphidinium_carterae.1